jgi:hypothetical protein
VLRETTSRGLCGLGCVGLLYFSCVCVFITAGPSTKLCAWGGGGYWGTCVTRDDEPRPVWTSLPITHSVLLCVCLLLQYLLQSCARGGRRIVEDMCCEIRRAEACVD